MNPDENSKTVKPNIDEDDGIDYSDFIVPIPHNYHTWPAREHNDWEDLDASERFMADPGYIDKI